MIHKTEEILKHKSLLINNTGRVLISRGSSLFHSTTKLTQTKTANKSNGRKIGNNDKTTYVNFVKTCFM